MTAEARRPYAVTLHPFEERQYVTQVMGVALGQVPPSELAARVAWDPVALALAVRAAPRMRDAVSALRAGDNLPWSRQINFTAGLLSAWEHPAWYLGDVGLSFGHGGAAHPLRGYSRSMAILAARSPALGAAAGDIREGFAGPRSAGSCILAGDILLLLRDLERRPLWFIEALKHEGYAPREVLAPLLEALHYCRERRLALLELTDAVDPEHGAALIPEEHLRGGVWGRLHPEILRRTEEMLAA
ncbi:MAG: hypothetical protein JNK72_26270 [Myxococcales bacterium]|nr:hypothetical protein [Myxococcales bacterium]